MEIRTKVVAAAMQILLKTSMSVTLLHCSIYSLSLRLPHLALRPPPLRSQPSSHPLLVLYNLNDSAFRRRLDSHPYRTIGEESFSTVRRAIWSANQLPVAVKLEPHN